MEPVRPFDPRPDVTAAERGGDASIGMDGEADLLTASREEAMFWQKTYQEITAMEDKVMDRVRQLMAGQSVEARREVALTNVPVIAAQAERFRKRLGYWDERMRQLG